MEKQPLFIEKQRFNQWWMWLILLGTNGIFIYGWIQQIYLNTPFGDHPMSNTGLWIAVLVMLAFTLFMRSFCLETSIYEDGIYVRFVPLQKSFRIYQWDMFEEVYVRKYAPLSEYGGWGYRVGFGNAGGALNIAGDMGIQLVFKDKMSLLIGTQKPEEAQKALTLINLSQVE